MLAVRPSIAAVISAANRIEAPSADKGATFSIATGIAVKPDPCRARG
jgi:hypothetical protein